MTAIPVPQRTDYGLRLGFPVYETKPDRLELAYNEMIDRWAAYMHAPNECTYAESQRLLEAARLADVEYARLLNVWIASHEPCTCDERTGLACPACIAHHEIYGEEMPY